MVGNRSRRDGVGARRRRRRYRGWGVGVGAGLLLGSLALTWNGSAGAVGGPSAVLVASPAGSELSKIEHVIVIMQENRSFDHYFGTYPGADGIPVDANGDPTVCVNDPETQRCVYPWHDPADISNAGPHGARSARNDINDGRMDGFLSEYYAALKHCRSKPNAPDCGIPKPVPDVMSYKTRSDLPEYYAYADNYVLMDHMFGTGRTWSLPEHLFMVSNWSARCYRPGDPMSCENEVDAVDDARFQPSPDYAWTDVTHLLSENQVSWGYYVFDGTEPDCEDPGALSCIPLPQSYRTGSIWNPLPFFTDVKDHGQLDNIQSVDNFVAAAQGGSLPAVSWVVPTNSVSEHAPAKLSDGREYVTYMINQVMQGPDWDSTAIFLAWDDWGGFYDHMVPPDASANGFGLRVPSLLISPYAKQGFVDHGVHSFDSYQRFIEDVFLDSARLDPTTDGRPDPRPVVGENYPGLADLADDFDFTQEPREPIILGTTNADGLAAPITPKSKEPAPSPGATADAAGRTILPPATTKPPAIEATGDPITGAGPFTVVFDGSQTTDGTSSIVEWSLDFGDGTSTEGTGAPPSAVSHTYARAGAHTAHLHVLDQSAKTGDDMLVVNVTPAPPKVWIAGDKPLGFDELTESFDASESSAGNWTISFGDGTPDKRGTGAPPAALEHTFDHVGIYTTTLTVTDPVTGLSSVARAISTVSASRAPSATTKTPDVGAASAHLLADLWTNGKPTTYHFEWGTSPDHLTNATAIKNAHTGASSVAVPIDGITDGMRYYFRVVATNSIGTTVGETLSFTSATGPKVAKLRVTAVTSSSATLSGMVNPAGSVTVAHFEWGLGGTIDHIAPEVALGSGNAKVAVTATITGLLPDTTYSYRLLATNAARQTTSVVKTFTTQHA